MSKLDLPFGTKELTGVETNELKRIISNCLMDLEYDKELDDYPRVTEREFLVKSIAWKLDMITVEEVVRTYSAMRGLNDPIMVSNLTVDHRLSETPR